MNSSELIIFTLAFFVSAGAILVMLRAGVSWGLVDAPDSDRKTHKGNVPLVGGICVFIAIAAVQFIAPTPVFVIIAGAIVLLAGVIDDRFELSPRLRLVVQAAAAVILVFGGGYVVQELGPILFTNPVLLGGLIAFLFSVLCIVGVINAVNMIDGADGLAGGTVAISISSMLFISYYLGNLPETTLSQIAVLGALAAFLSFNLGLFGQSRRVFLGDAGSMFLGLVTAIYLIDMSQGADPVIRTVSAGWLLGLPLLDCVSVMVGRVLKGKSPFAAGSDHFHHQLFKTGLTRGVCVSIMLSIHSLLVLVGIIGNLYSLPEQLLFWGFVLLTIGHYFLTPMVISHLRQSGLLTPNSTPQ